MSIFTSYKMIKGAKYNKYNQMIVVIFYCFSYFLILQYKWEK